MGINVNFYDKVIYITSPTNSVTVQELVDAIRAAEDSELGMKFIEIIDAVGKANLGGGFYTVITMTLNSDWYIEFWDGVNLGQISAGNIVGGKDDRPVRATSGSADTILVLGAERGVLLSEFVISQTLDETIDRIDKTTGDNQALILAK
jgi:hypothetical protein